MARRKKMQSRNLALLRARLAGMRSISAKLDLGSGINVGSMDKLASTLDGAVKSYNTALSDLDKQLNGIQALERQAADLASRALAAAAGKWGRDSNEYEQVGGVRRSEKKKGKRKAKAPAKP